MSTKFHYGVYFMGGVQKKKENPLLSRYSYSNMPSTSFSLFFAYGALVEYYYTIVYVLWLNDHGQEGLPHNASSNFQLTCVNYIKREAATN